MVSVTNITASAAENGGIGVFGVSIWDGGTVYVSGTTNVEHRGWPLAANITGGGTVYFSGDVICTGSPSNPGNEICFFKSPSDTSVHFHLSEPTGTGIERDGYIWDEYTDGLSYVYKR